MCVLRLCSATLLVCVFLTSSIELNGIGAYERGREGTYWQTCHLLYLPHLHTHRCTGLSHSSCTCRATLRTHKYSVRVYTLVVKGQSIYDQALTRHTRIA